MTAAVVFHPKCPLCRGCLQHDDCRILRRGGCACPPTRFVCAGCGELVRGPRRTLWGAQMHAGHADNRRDAICPSRHWRAQQ